MGTESLSCPNCGAALRVGVRDSVVTCGYCHSTIRLTTQGPAESVLTAQSSDAIALSPSVTEQIKALLKEGRRIEAIKLYREETKGTLKASKDAVDAMAASMGIEFRRAGGSRWSCVGLVAAFLLWAGGLALTPAGVGWMAELIFEDSLSREMVEMLQVGVTLLLALGPVAGLIVWASVGGGGQEKHGV